MENKISILLPTNRRNNQIINKIKELPVKFPSPTNVFNDEFNDLIKDRVSDTNHYLEPTLRSIEKQKFKDIELIISHKNPSKEEEDIVKSYNVNVKLIKEKHSLWHDLGDKYPTLCNNINSAFIHSNGELLWRLDDLTFFNDNTAKELWDNWKRGLYSTSRTIRCIKYDGTKEGEEYQKYVGPRKIEMVKNGWIGQYKPLTENIYKSISKWMCWGCSSTISKDDFLKINGQDELWDGSICGTDMEMGMRLSQVSNHNRVATSNLIYEIDDIPYKYMARNDVVFRSMIKNKTIKANSWKPNRRERMAYRRWHKREEGELDENWDKFMEVPYIDLKKEYKLKRLGEVIYEV